MLKEGLELVHRDVALNGQAPLLLREIVEGLSWSASEGRSRRFGRRRRAFKIENGWWKIELEHVRALGGTLCVQFVESRSPYDREWPPGKDLPLQHRQASCPHRAPGKARRSFKGLITHLYTLNWSKFPYESHVGGIVGLVPLLTSSVLSLQWVDGISRAPEPPQTRDTTWSSSRHTKIIKNRPIYAAERQSGAHARKGEGRSPFKML